MTDSKVGTRHQQRRALVYVRQSSSSQVEHNRESTRRQYALADRARDLGWHPDRITIVDEDLGLSGATTEGRGGFARMNAEVALGQVGILLGLEVSRLARNNADWSLIPEQKKLGTPLALMIQGFRLQSARKNLHQRGAPTG